jgi:hypothetical protein
MSFRRDIELERNPVIGRSSEMSGEGLRATRACGSGTAASLMTDLMSGVRPGAVSHHCIRPLERDRLERDRLGRQVFTASDRG